MASVSTSLVELRNGDRMSRDEFLRRWEQLPQLKRAELIDGVVYLSSPVSELRCDYEALLFEWLLQYKRSVHGLKILPNATWLLGQGSPQPDLALIRSEGLSRRAGLYRTGPPELAIEICYSSRSYDLGPKLELYRREGVPEYLAVLLEDKRVEWRVLDGAGYYVLSISDGYLKSRTFPGLWLDQSALFPPDIRRLLAGVDEGLISSNR